jgi:hypothetical protein
MLGIVAPKSRRIGSLPSMVIVSGTPCSRIVLVRKRVAAELFVSGNIGNAGFLSQHARALAASFEAGQEAQTVRLQHLRNDMSHISRA